MNHYFKTIYLVPFLFYCLDINAQDNDTLYIRRNSKGIVQYARFKVNETTNRKMEYDTSFLKGILKANKDDSFHIMKESTNNFGVTNKKFQQYYKRLKVENAQVLLHGRNNNIEVFNGHFQIIEISSVNPSITEQEALKKAITFLGSKKYAWEDHEVEKFVKSITNCKSRQS